VRRRSSWPRAGGGYRRGASTRALGSPQASRAPRCTATTVARRRAESRQPVQGSRVRAAHRAGSELGEGVLGRRLIRRWSLSEGGRLAAHASRRSSGPTVLVPAPRRTRCHPAKRHEILQHGSRRYPDMFRDGAIGGVLAQLVERLENARLHFEVTLTLRLTSRWAAGPSHRNQMLPDPGGGNAGRLADHPVGGARTELLNRGHDLGACPKALFPVDAPRRLRKNTGSDQSLDMLMHSCGCATHRFGKGGHRDHHVSRGPCKDDDDRRSAGRCVVSGSGSHGQPSERPEARALPGRAQKRRSA
jgi:hypothetical protein